MRLALLATVAALALAGCASGLSKGASLGKPGQQVEAGYLGVVTKTNGLGFLLYLPKDYQKDSSQRWPLVLFLHGAGERGKDLQKVAVHGPPKQVREGKDFPFILVSPQCPENQVWDDSVLMGLLDAIEADHRVDPKRIYVTGLSMGGYGTWQLAQKHPQRFAAVAPICGGGDRIRALLPSHLESLRSLGVWAFHGGKDTVVLPSESEWMVEAFRRAGGKDVRLTVYPEAGHDSWTEAYANAGLFEWLLTHSR